MAAPLEIHANVLGSNQTVRAGAARRYIQVVVENGVLLHQTRATDGDTLIQQNVLTIIKSRDGVKIGCTFFTWEALDMTYKQAAETVK